MNNSNKLGASIGKASPTPQPFKPEDNFFNQFFAAPNPLDSRQIILHPLPGTGIPMRDYFAASAMGTCIHSHYGGDPSSAREVAEWCYRVADAMLEARKPHFNNSQP